MSATTELIALLDVKAEEFAESTSARTAMGMAVRSDGKGSSVRIATLDKLHQLNRLGELDKLGEITLLQILMCHTKEGIVWAHDENRQAELDVLVGVGGEPFGWIRVTKGEKVTVDSAPFIEFIDDPTARIELRRICRKDPQDLLDCVSDGQEVRAVRYFENPSTWMQ